jgi:hypothetical protein
MQRANDSDIQALIAKGNGKASHYITQAPSSHQRGYFWAYKKNFHLIGFMNPIRFMAESKKLAIAFGILNKNHSSLAVVGN